MMRPFREGGQGSYDQILPKFQKMCRESRNQDQLLCERNLHPSQSGFLPRMYCIMADLGFKQISVEPVVADPPEADYAHPGGGPAEDLCEEYDRLAARDR